MPEIFTKCAKAYCKRIGKAQGMLKIQSLLTDELESTLRQYTEEHKFTSLALILLNFEAHKSGSFCIIFNKSEGDRILSEH